MKKNTFDLLKDLENTEDFGTYFDENKDEFLSVELSDYLNGLLQQRGLKKIDVIKRAELSQIYGYQIFSGIRRPGKYKMICIALAIGLDLEETQKLLKACGFVPLYPKNCEDSVYIYSIHCRFTVSQMNALLEHYGYGEVCRS